MKIQTETIIDPSAEILNLQEKMVNEVSDLLPKSHIDGVEVAVQIMSKDNKMVDIHRNLIDTLRNDEELRKRYEEFKRTLSGLSREEYKKRKSEWLEKNILHSKSNIK